MIVGPKWVFVQDGELFKKGSWLYTSPPKGTYPVGGGANMLVVWGTPVGCCGVAQ